MYGFKIRGPRKPKTSDDFAYNWNLLSQAFTKIHRHEKDSITYESLFRATFNIVSAKEGERLYNTLVEFEKEWLVSHVLPPIQAMASQVVHARAAGSSAAAEFSSQLLVQLVDAWKEYKLSTILQSDVLIHLDRFYCYDKQTFIGTVFINHFRDLVVYGSLAIPSDLDQDISHVLLDIIARQIDAEREGQGINRPLVGSLVDMLVTIAKNEKTVYDTTFKDPLIERSRQYFRAKAKQLEEQVEPAEYFNIVNRFISEDYARCCALLTTVTAVEVLRVIDDEMIDCRLESLLNLPLGLRHLITVGAVSDLENVYRLNMRISDKAIHIARVIRPIVQEMGLELNRSTLATVEKQPENETSTPAGPGGKQAADRSVNRHTSAALKWSESLLNMKIKFDDVWKRAFHSNLHLQAELTNGFIDFVNTKDFNRAPEYISLFIDATIRKHSKEATQIEFEDRLDLFITLIRYVTAKDAMQTYYKKHFGKRLLMNKSNDMTIEHQLISRLKKEMGHSFTSKLEIMSRDMDTSQTLSVQYRDHVAARTESRSESDEGAGTSGIQFQINVLHGAAWPMDHLTRRDVSSSCSVPDSLASIKTSFENYYHGLHQGRALTWQDGLGSVELRATFNSVPTKDGRVKERQHVLVVNMYGLAILSAFDSILPSESLTYDEIKSHTEMVDQLLIPNLRPFCLLPKTRILIKEPMSREINPTDRFRFNDAFQSAFYKITIAPVAVNKVETDKEKKGTDKQLASDRLLSIQAVIVRIMKHRKKMAQAELVTETTRQIRASFVPDIPQIKKGIEATIEKEYLEVTVEEGEVICNYVA